MQQGTAQAGYGDAFVEVDGARVHYLDAGNGPPMLLIHGLVGSSANWRLNLPALARHAHVYALDLVNMGHSQRVPGLDASLRATAGRVIAFMDALGLDSVDLVAHSHGGAVALMLAALYPSRVRRLLLFAPVNPFSRSSDAMVRVYSHPFGILLARMLPWLPTPLQRIALGEIYGGPGRVADSCLREIVAGLRCPLTLRHVLTVIRSWFTEMAELKAVLPRVAPVPTLLVWGANDCTVSPDSAAQLKAILPGAELRMVPRAGHTVFEQFPAIANRMMLAWLRRRPRRHRNRPGHKSRPRKLALLKGTA